MKSTWPKTLAELRNQVGALLFSSAVSFQKTAILDEVKTSSYPLSVKFLYHTQDDSPVLVHLGDKNSYQEISCSVCSPEYYSGFSGACSHVISAIAYCLENDQCPFPPGKTPITDSIKQTETAFRKKKDFPSSPSVVEPASPKPDRLLWHEQQGEKGFIVADRYRVPIDSETIKGVRLRSHLPGYSHRPENRFFLELESYFQISKLISLGGRQVNLFIPKSINVLKRLINESPFIIEKCVDGNWFTLPFAIASFHWIGIWVPNIQNRTIHLDSSWVIMGKKHPSSFVQFFCLGEVTCILLSEKSLFFIDGKLSERVISFLQATFFLQPADLLYQSSFLTSEDSLSFHLKDFPYPPKLLQGEKWNPVVDIRDFHRKGVSLFIYLFSVGIKFPLFGPQRLNIGDVLWCDDRRYPDHLCLIHRDRQKELFYRNIVEKNLGRGSTDQWISFSNENRSVVYQKVLPSLEKAGFARGELESSENLLYSGEVDLFVKLSSKSLSSERNDLFNHKILSHCILKWKDHVWSMPVSREDAGDPVLHLSEGFAVLMDQEFQQKMHDLVLLLEPDKDGRSIISQYYASILLRSRPDLPFLPDEELVDRLFPFKVSSLSAKQSSFLEGAVRIPLREYQIDGVAWIHSLRLSGLGGILADEMGLGKTLTVLSELVLEAERAKTHSETLPPTLIVLPATLLFNWEKEISKYAPTLTVAIHHGAGRWERWNQALLQNVILSTYGTVRNDLEEMVKVRFHGIILDEAQVIKNPASGIASALFSLKSSFKLALSGTPIENHLMDLWSIFAFVMPGLLGSRRRFERIFVEEGGFGKWDSDRIALLRSLIAPLILRRTKENVLKDLPPKIMIDYWIDPTPEERQEYKKLKENGRNSLKGISGGAYRLGVFSLLMTLRRFCCHPDLVKRDPPLDFENPAKFQIVKEKISEALEDGHGVILFSQFVGVLDRFEEYFRAERIPVLRLDGGTSLVDRQRMVEIFQNNDELSPRLFLSSLKAGGVGLTLTNADYVFHYDPWWNPQVENQATDRAHRMGQDKTVFVYRFLTRGTVEEHVARLKEKKVALFAKVMADETFELSEGLDLTEIESLLSSDGEFL